MPESINVVKEEAIQHLFNTHSTVIQHHSNVELVEKAQTPDEEIDSDPQQFIQHITKEEGERGCVEQVQSENVLQNASEEENKSVLKTEVL